MSLEEEKVQVGLTSPYLKTGRYENERFSKNLFKKTFRTRRIKDIKKSPRCPKNLKVPPMCRGKKAVHHLREYSRKSRKKKMGRNTSSYTDPGKPPQGVGKTTEVRQPPKYPSTSSQQTGRGEAEQTPGGYVCC
jgi:hypothetical protein